jgi:hypothetical protein
MAAVRGRFSDLPVFLVLPVRQPAYSGHLFRLATITDGSNPQQGASTMTFSPFIPLTAIDCTIPALLIDRNAPLDVLHANAIARILAVTQLMEMFSSREVQEADSVDLKHVATVATQLLRDGCDLLDVLGWRLRPS